MSIEADPRLLSLLQKVANPLQALSLTVRLRGVFAPPEQWKLTDEANPNLFSYSLQFLGQTFSSGRIQPRKLTERELREQEQAKNKKGAKKQSKQEQKVEDDPQAQRRKAEWQRLSQEQRFYRTQEDPYKAFSLGFPQREKVSQLDRQKIRELQGLVESGRIPLILIRKPEINEQEVAKLKKTKPKTLNLGELYAARYRGWLQVANLSEPGATHIQARVRLQFVGDLPPESFKIQTQQSYVGLELELGTSLNPLVEGISPQTRGLLGADRPARSGGSAGARLMEQVRKGLRAISQQYSAFFVREKEHGDDKKFGTSGGTTLHNVSTLRINEINKRKDLFLAQFASSGKLAILRERLARTLRTIVVDRLRKQRQGGAISKAALQQTLGELNVYLRQLIGKTVDDCISGDAAGLHEDLILGHQHTRSARKQAISAVASESAEEREVRLAEEYEVAGRTAQAEEKHLNLVLINNDSGGALANYAQFCLRHGHLQQAYALYRRISSESGELLSKIVLALFQVQRNREQQAITQLSQLAEEAQSIDDKILVAQLLSFVHERLGEERKAEKHLALAQKYFQIKSNPILKVNPPINPYQQPVPRVPKPGKYVSPLSSHQAQEMRIRLMGVLTHHCFFGLARDYLPKLSESQKKKQYLVQILVHEGRYDEALEVVEGMLEKQPRSLQLLQLKSDICFKSERMFQCEEVFLQVLRLKPTPPQSYSIYLRLGLTYLNRKSWQDAKGTFNKALELKNNSSLAWLGLGIANLHLNLLADAEEAFNLAKIYNPTSEEPEGYLKEIWQAIAARNQLQYKYLYKE